MNWKKLWIKAEQLMGEAGAIAFDRTSLLVSLWNDAEFRSDCESRHVEVEEELDRLTEDLNFTFLELQELQNHRPDRKDWENGKLRTMYDKLVSELRGKNKGYVLKKSKPETERLKERLRTVLDELAQLRKKYAEQGRELAKARKEIAAIHKILNSVNV